MLLALTLFGFASPSFAAATTYYVSPSGNDNNAGTMAAPFKTIQTAINNANTGDTVTLEDGTYTGPGNVDLDFGGVSITVDSVNGAAKTTIDCGGNSTSDPQIIHRALRFHTSEANAVLSGLTIQNGYESSNGGAVDVENGSIVALTNCVITGNTSDDDGAVYNAGTVKLTGCTINANTGDGVYNYGTATITGCAIGSAKKPNTGTGVYAGGMVTLNGGCMIIGNTGGGINAPNYDGAAITLTDCTISSNTSSYGGGVYVGADDTITLTDCIVNDNTVSGFGGGFYNDGTVSLTGCTLNGNMAIYDPNNGNNASGGGVYNANSATLNACVITGNTTTGNGGGIDNPGNLTLTNCQITGNSTSSGNGGGVDNEASATALLQFCAFSVNKANASATGTQQGGALENDGTATLTDDILWNDMATSGNEIGIPVSGNQMTTTTYSDIQGGYRGTGNIHADPMFANPAIGNFHLVAGSPCLGAGIAITGVTTDLIGATRGNPPSMGAYENPQPSTTTLTSSVNPSTFGQSVTFTATVTGTGGTPSGTVTFTIDGTAQTPVALNASGIATYSTFALAGGSHTVTAAYNGDTTFATSNSATLTQVVTGVASTTTLASSLNPSAFGQSVTFTATVAGTGGTPSGTVTFTVDGTAQTPVALNASGKAAYSASSLIVGPHSIKATYSGDGKFASSVSSTLTQTVNVVTTTTTLASSLNPSPFGQSVQFTATVHGNTATGNVVFTDMTSGTTLGSAALSGGVATFTASSLSVGSHQIVASYGGDSDNSASASSALTQVVNAVATTTTLISSLNPSTTGQSVTFTATVAGSGGTLTGTVTFTVNGTAQTPMTLNGSGQATYTTTSLPVGQNHVTATYSGNATFGTSTSSALTQTVNAISTTTKLTSSLNPSIIGQSVTFTATVAGTGGTPTGTVTFTIDGTAQAPVTLTNGSAVYNTSTLAVGTHTITAAYSGDTTFAVSSSSTLTQTVNTISTTTTLISSLNPSIAGQSVTFTATVIAVSGSSIPTGTVQFAVDGSNVGSPVTLNGSGQAVYTTAGLSGGSHTLTAVYTPAGTFAASASSTLTQTVNAVATTTALISSLNPSSAGASVTFTATVKATSGSAIPTGTVTFKDGSATLGTITLNSSGQAAFSTASLTVGAHSITATYIPTGSFSGSAASALTQTVNAAAATHTQILWVNTNGQASLWNIASDGSRTAPVYGPYAGWTAKAVSDGPDGTPHILWTNTNGTAAVWNIGAGTSFTSHQYGPYPNYAAVSLSTGGDGVSHLLWNRTDGQASLWAVNTTTGAFTNHEYGPYTGWTANAVASGATVTDLLWTNTNGATAGYRFTSDGVLTTSVFGPYPTYGAKALSVSQDDGAHLLWDKTDGTAALWNVNFSTGGFTSTTYGPFSGWTAEAIATGTDNTAHMLWNHAPDNQASLWALTGSGFTAVQYGPFSGWQAVAVSAGP